MVVDQGNGNAQHDLGEGFASADAFSSIKGAKSEGIPWLAVRTLVHW